MPEYQATRKYPNHSPSRTITAPPQQRRLTPDTL
jgi:hypothetical protein